VRFGLLLVLSLAGSKYFGPLGRNFLEFLFHGLYFRELMEIVGYRLLRSFVVHSLNVVVICGMGHYVRPVYLRICGGLSLIPYSYSESACPHPLLRYLTSSVGFLNPTGRLTPSFWSLSGRKCPSFLSVGGIPVILRGA
jgi:hypothetical protein